MKRFKILGLLLLTIGAVSCESDDDLPEVQEIDPIVITSDSKFNAGDDEYEITGGVVSNVATNEGDRFTQLIFLGDGLEFNRFGIQGRGPLAQLVIYNDINVSNIAGTYELSSTAATGTAVIVYSEDFNVNGSQDADGRATSGTVIIERVGENQYIVNVEDGETEGEDADDDDDNESFDLFFDGEVYVVN
ncbi:hypothetical protein [Nonlabens ponticola]|uniref:Uncharacterized protein n=1 Tax=Nonlabens ponticola TaxID=2496866 RepID=A0A3S9MWV2_9FLAO|nr:hypothetical protein [Nonlabens ponticola]AZQ43599.1 hypothetical protein EJ995_04875 [Nonlabens ponticola]